MFCANCGNPLQNNARLCTTCEVQVVPPTHTASIVPPVVVPTYQPATRQSPPIPYIQPLFYEKNPVAIIGFVLSFVGILCLAIAVLSAFFLNIVTYTTNNSGIAFPATIAGFICSIIGLKRSKITFARKGRSFAIAGIVLSSVTIGILVLAIVALILVFVGLAKYAGAF